MRGQRLMRRRGEMLERSFAHVLETGGMRRTHLRFHYNIAKRMLIHVAGFNLGLLMRKRFGVGTPRGLQGRVAAAIAAFVALIDLISDSQAPIVAFVPPPWPEMPCTWRHKSPCPRELRSYWRPCTEPERSCRNRSGSCS